MTWDCTLCLVTDRALLPEGGLVRAVVEAVLGGCTMVQLREKSLSSRAFCRQAEEVKRVTDRYGVPLIVNDRVDIALAVGAAGAHVGQRDLPAAAARRLLGPDRLLGVSAATVEEALEAQAAGADYLGVGAMFPTSTKSDAVLVSAGALGQIRRAVSLPIVAIGGVDAGNAGWFRAQGVDGLAVVSAILAQRDIRRAAAGLKTAFLTG